MRARLHEQTVDEDCHNGDDPDHKSDGVTGRPSKDGKEEWEGRLTVFGPSRAGTAVITSAFRHAAPP